MVSHHKAIDLLLKQYNEKLLYKSPNYCATLCFHAELNSEYRNGYSITNTSVLYK